MLTGEMAKVHTTPLTVRKKQLPRKPGNGLKAEMWNDCIHWACKNIGGNVELLGAYEGTRLVGLATYRPGKITKLVSISSYHRGAGTVLFNALPKPLWCKGLEVSRGFYEKMGMIELCPITVVKRQASIYIKL